jgi:hypothetical protein
VSGVGALGLWLALGLAELAPVVELGTEAGAGEAPLTAGAAPRPGVATSLRPAAELRLGGRETFFTFRYGPTLTFRRPKLIAADRPLLLHTMAAAGTVAAARTVTLALTSSLSVGEADYRALPGLLGDSQSALPDAQELLIAGAALQVTKQFGARLTGGAFLDVYHRRTLDERPAAGDRLAIGQALPRQTGISVAPRLTARLSARDLAEASLGFTRENREPDLAFLVLSPRLLWQRQLARTRTLSLLGGLAYTRISGDRPGQTTFSRAGAVWPVAAARLEGPLARGPSSALIGSFDLGMDSVIDPVLDRVGPRGNARGRLSLTVSPPWQLVASGGFSTSLRSEPAPVASIVARPPDETRAAAEVRLRHRLSPHLVLEAQGRWSDRAPHLTHDQLQFRQRELWFSLAATYRSRPARDL